MGVHVDSREAVAYHLKEARHRSAVLRSLLGIARVLKRDVILPRMLCYCDFMWKVRSPPSPLATRARVCPSDRTDPPMLRRR